MGNELMLGGGGQPDEGRAVARRSSRSMRAVQRRGELDLAQLLNTGRQQEARAMLRKRFTEDGLQDVTDVFNLGQELAAENPAVAGLLGEIVREFARTTARDIRDFGRGRGF